MDCVQTFLEDMKLSAQSVDIAACCNQFLNEMEMGLNAEGAGSLHMIPTYMDVNQTTTAGKSVIVLDAGGTNYRTCLVTFDECSRPNITHFHNTVMPGSVSEVSKTEFYAALADGMEQLLPCAHAVGFCFSYAAEVTKDHDSIPKVFSKEIRAAEVIGTKLGVSLFAELASRGYDVTEKRISIVNDTVATLLAAKTAAEKTYDSYIGFILGTGTNTAYVEQNKHIRKVSGLPPGSQIINVESGSFDYALGPLDELFFSMTKDPGAYHFEKMISGAYLGQFAKLVMQTASSAGIFSPEFTQACSVIDEFSTAHMSYYLEDPNAKNSLLGNCVSTAADAHALTRILDALVARAAKLTAANLAAAILKSEAGRKYPVCINADGTTYYRTKNLQSYTEKYLSEFLENQNLRAEFVHIAHSPIIGAAIAGLSNLT